MTFLTSSVGDEVGSEVGDLVGIVVGCNEKNDLGEIKAGFA